VLDCPDPESLARFWATLVGGEPVRWYDGWWTLEPPPHGQRLSFQRSDQPARRGGVHVDLLVDDLEAAHHRAVAAGAAFVAERWSPRPAADGRPVPWRVYEDPAGHAFCLVVR
jgi:Glyoxalase-like domain